MNEAINHQDIENFTDERKEKKSDEDKRKIYIILQVQLERNLTCFTLIRKWHTFSNSNSIMSKAHKSDHQSMLFSFLLSFELYYFIVDQASRLLPLSTY